MCSYLEAPTKSALSPSKRTDRIAKSSRLGQVSRGKNQRLPAYIAMVWRQTNENLRILYIRPVPPISCVQGTLGGIKQAASNMGRRGLLPPAKPPFTFRAFKF